MVGQMHDGGLDARPVLHWRRDFGRKLAAMHLATGALRFEHLVFGDLVMQAWNIKHLAGLDNRSRGQRTKTGITVARWRVGFNVIHCRSLLQGATGVPLLAALGFWPALRCDFGLGLNPSEDGGLLELRLFCARRPSSSATLHVRAATCSDSCRTNPRSGHNSRIRSSFSATLSPARSGSSSMPFLIGFRRRSSNPE